MLIALRGSYHAVSMCHGLTRFYHALRVSYQLPCYQRTLHPTMLSEGSLPCCQTWEGLGHAYSQSFRGSYNALRGSNMLSEEPTLTILPELSQIVTFSDDAIAWKWSKISFLKINQKIKVSELSDVISANINMHIAVLLSPTTSLYDLRKPRYRFCHSHTAATRGCDKFPRLKMGVVKRVK